MEHALASAAEPVPLRPLRLSLDVGRLGHPCKAGLHEIDPTAALFQLPPLLKAYLRLGGFIGDGAVVDEQFNTTDVCVVVKTAMIADKYARHYQPTLRETPAATTGLDE